MMSTKDTAALLDNCLRVRKLTRSVHHEHIREIFGSYGRIQSVEILVDKRNGVSKGIALVSFCSLEDAENAMFYLDGGQIDGCAIEVSITERSVGNKRESAKHAKSQRKVDNHQISPGTADAAYTGGTQSYENTGSRDENAAGVQRNEATLRHEVSREGSVQRRVVNQRDPIADSSRGMHVQQRLDRSFVRNENRVDVLSYRQHDRVERIPVHRQEQPGTHSRYSGDIGAVMYGRPEGIYGYFGGRPSHVMNYTVPMRNHPVELSMRHDPIRNGFRDDARIPYAAPRLEEPNSRRVDEDSRRRSPGRYVPKDRSIMSGRDVPPRYRSRSRERALASSRIESSSHYGPNNPPNRSNEARLAPVRDRNRRVVDARERERETRRSADSRAAADRRIPDVRDRGRRPLDDRGRDGRRVDSRERDRRVDADSRDRNKYSRPSRSASSSLPVDPRRRRRRSNSDSSSHSSASSGSSAGSSSGKKSGRSSSRSRSSSKSTGSNSSDSHGGKDLSDRLP